MNIPAGERVDNDEDLYGLLAEFLTPESLLSTAERAREEGYTRTDAFSPFPIDGLAEAVGMRKNRVPLVTLCGGVAGGAFAYFMMWYVNVVDYPMNVGGRPFHSWPSFIPITFELTILFAAFGAVLGMLLFNRLPEPYHPIFNGKHFERASQDRFFLAIEKDDPLFDLERTHRFLNDSAAVNVDAVTYSGRPLGEVHRRDAGAVNP